MVDREDQSALRSLLLHEDLWAKKSSEGSNSLFRAISVCLYFTDRYQDIIRRLLLAYFNSVHCSALKSESQLKEKERYLQSMSLIVFEPTNLEIISRLFNVNPVLYFLDAKQLKRQNFGREHQPAIRLLRVSPLYYTALFPKSQKQDYVHVQNIVLSLVESVLESRKFEYRSLNDEKFINYDYRRWSAQSKLPPTTGAASVECDYRLLRLPAANPADLHVEEKVSLRKEGVNGGDLGTEIISLFKKRKNSLRVKQQSPSEPEDHFITKSFADQKVFLQMAPRAGAHLRSQSLRTGQKEWASVSFEVNDLEGDLKVVERKPDQNMSLGDRPTEADREGEEEQGSGNQLIEELDDESLHDKADDLKGLIAFELDRDNKDEKPAKMPLTSEISSLAHPAANSSSSNTVLAPGSEKSDNPKPLLKVSLRERIRQKQTASRLPATSFAPPTTPLLPPLPNLLPLPADSRPSDQSLRLISELKGIPFGKEKYTEIVDSQLHTGILKFFDEKNGFGFFQILKENEFGDVFVYKSEFDKADIKVEALKTMKNVYSRTFSFQIATYFVHNDRRKKAINIKLV